MTTDNTPGVETADERQAKQDAAAGATVAELAAKSQTVTVKTDAMLPGAETQEEIDLPIGSGPADTRIVQSVYPTPIAEDQNVAGADEVQEKMDEATEKGYIGWRPGDKE
jgi:hypothetical protein